MTASATAPAIEIAVRHRLGRFKLDARFQSGRGLTALFGRSGAGKTSLVNIIAGLTTPDEGRIVIDGAVLLDTARGIAVPTHRRRIGYVFQEGRLFPHLTVRHNLVFGRWFHRQQAGAIGFDDVIAMLGVAPLLERRPATLSGGEKQRVAIGRALLAHPRVLLMDEPLASLDGPRKDEILPYIERLRDEVGIPIVYVSHSVAEVTRLATTMVLMSDGAVDAVGTPSEIMGRLDLQPRTGRFEAGAVLEATVAGSDTYGLMLLRCGGGEIRVPQVALPVGARVRLRIRARDVIVATERPRGLSALNILAGTIAEIGPAAGPVRDLRIALDGADLLARVTVRSLTELGLVPGRLVFAVVKSVALDRQSLGIGRERPGDGDFVESADA